MCFFNKDKFQQEGNDISNLDYRDKYSKLKIHMVYCIVIGCIFIVELFTVRGYSSDDLNAMIGFAATISGIILSVLAIIMTIVGETKSENTKDKMLDISEQLNKTVKMIDKAVNGLNESAESYKKILSSNCELNESVRSLNESLNNKSYSGDKTEEEVDNTNDVATYLLERIIDVYPENIINQIVKLLYYIAKKQYDKKFDTISFQEVSDDYTTMDLDCSTLKDSWKLLLLFPPKEVYDKDFFKNLNGRMKMMCKSEKKVIDDFFNHQQ